jgi:hypothetical protein
MKTVSENLQRHVSHVCQSGIATHEWHEQFMTPATVESRPNYVEKLLDNN